MTDRPVRAINPCRVPGCVFRGDPCPYHADDAPPRPPTLAERRGARGEPIGSRSAGTDADRLQPHQLAAVRRLTDPEPAS